MNNEMKNNNSQSAKFSPFGGGRGGSAYVIIDMGSSRISVMAVEMLENGGVRILSEESKKSDKIKYGIVEQPSMCAFIINELTRLLQNSARLNEINKLCVSLNAKTMKHFHVRINRSLGFGKPVTEEILSGMLAECEEKFNQPGVEVFDTIPRYYELDGIKTNHPVEKKGSELSAFYNVIIGNSSIKEELERCFERVKDISTHEFMPLGVEALSTAVLDEEEKEAGCALINFGATTTTLAVYSDGVLQQLLVVPLGGKNITKDIQELGISEANAEKLKTLKGSALRHLVEQSIRVQIPPAEAGSQPVTIETDFLATIIEARLSEIMTPILKAIDETHFNLKAGIVITGGGAKLNNIVDFLEEKTGMEVRYGDHSDWLSECTHKRFEDPIYAQQIGCAVLLHEYEKENKIEEQELAEPKKQKKSNWLGLGKWREKIKQPVLKLFEDENYLK